MAAKRRKRSVAELFAAVPLVPRGRDGGQQGSGKGKKAAKRKAEKDKGKLVLAVSVKTKKKKEVPAGPGIDVREKVAHCIASTVDLLSISGITILSGTVECLYSPACTGEKQRGKGHDSISISRSVQHSIKKREPKNCSSKKKEKQEVSVLLDKKGKKGNRKSVSERHKKDMTNSVQAQSICKNQSKAGFSTVLNTTDMRCKSNSSCKSKHVTFSDGTVKFRRTAHLPEDNTKQPQSVQTFQQPTQEGCDHRNTDEQQLVYQQAEAISGAVETTSSLSENLVPVGVCRTIPLTKPKDITILGNSVDLNHCIETSHGSNCLNSTSLACLSSKVPCQSFKGVDSHLNGDNSLSLDVECLGEQDHMTSQASFNPVNLAAKAISGDRSPLSQPSGSCLYDRSRSTFQERAVAFGKVSSELLRSGNMVRNISSSTGSNKPAQAADCISACRNNHNRDDYVGLPINSRAAVRAFVPGTSSFRTNGHNQQPELATANNRYVQPVDWRNEKHEVDHDGIKAEGLEHLRNCRRPAEKDDLPMTLPKKPCTVAQKGLHMLRFAETGLEFRGSRPDVQPQPQPICLDDEDEADLRLGNTESHPTWSKAVSTLRPVKLNPGAKHVQQPSGSSVYQENPWPVHSVTPPLAPGERVFQDARRRDVKFLVVFVVSEAPV
ncbi:unnamed protein product [Miscanthus lutarioriparius]|uniref:Uncharacterized protein n=1 Tax=Miscanthus lutarioriparius TaxID=422564 RepID=A0A811RWD8_9POAL|nr:unnamed protein product [Miscanthus lutarioriparius]